MLQRMAMPERAKPFRNAKWRKEVTYSGSVDFSQYVVMSTLCDCSATAFAMKSSIVSEPPLKYLKYEYAQQSGNNRACLAAGSGTLASAATGFTAGNTAAPPAAARNSQRNITLLICTSQHRCIVAAHFGSALMLRVCAARKLAEIIHALIVQHID